MLSDLLFRLRALFHRNAVESELDEELRAHLQNEVEKYVASGMPQEEAARRARLALGGLEQIKEQCREARGIGLIHSTVQDIRYALRVRRKSPGFTAVSLLTIAMGIAANVSVFSFVDALFLRRVPAKDPARLVRILSPENDGGGLFSYPEYEYLRDHAKTTEVLGAHYSTSPLYINANGKVGEVQGAVVSSNYFSMLGLQPELGRFFSPDEDSVPGRDAVAVLGYRFWQRIFGGDPRVVGRTFLINGNSFEIIGVMAKDFQGVEIGGMPNEIWIPAMMLRVGYRGCSGFEPSCTFLSVMGRLRPGSTAAEVQAEITTLMRQLQSSRSGFDERLNVSVTPAIGISGGRGYFTLLARLLMTVGGLLLLIVCANIGGLLVARGTSRGPEIAMRLALGAGRRRIVQQLLTESLLLVLAGSAVGALISVWTSRLLVGFYSVDDEGYRHLFDLRPDASVVLYSITVTVAAGVLFGLLPALQASRADLNEVLKSGSILRSNPRLSRGALVTVQAALALALLVGAGLLARSGARIEAGMNLDVHHVLGLRLRPELLQYSAAKAYAFKREVVQRLRRLPGVQSVSLAKGQGLVWHPNPAARMKLPGQTYPKAADEPLVLYKPIAPDYFATLRIPFVAGRDFNDGDRPGSLRVAIVNETLAGQISPQALPLSQTIVLDDRPYQIVGVVKDAQLRTALQGPAPMAYLAFWQDESLLDARMCIRLAGDPTIALPLIRQTIANIDPAVPITEAMPLIDQVRAAYTDSRVASAVLSCTAALALLLTAMGLYGVVAHEVSRRTREIGVRMALGGTPKHVVRLFLRRGLVPGLVGTVAGLITAFGASRLLAAWLIGVTPLDIATFSIAAGVLLTVALLASYLPARKAMRVDPMVALRYE
jgi:predicted permease